MLLDPKSCELLWCTFLLASLSLWPVLLVAADSAAPDGAALLGLGYGSDADSQDSGRSPQLQKPLAAKSEPALADQGTGASPAATSGDEAGAVESCSMSPATAAGGWVKDEEQKGPAGPSFVKGQR